MPIFRDINSDLDQGHTWLQYHVPGFTFPLDIDLLLEESLKQDFA